MKILNEKEKFINTKKKIYYGGVALIALICSSSYSQAMEVEDKDISRIRCLWNLEEQTFRTSALEILEKKVLTEAYNENFKLRTNYLKKLGQFLRENPNHILNLKIMKLGNENDDSPLSIFYQETLNQITQYVHQSDAEGKYQVLKLKTFYSHLPQNLTRLNAEGAEKLKCEMYTLHTALLMEGEIDENKLNYFIHSYLKEKVDTEELENLAAILPVNCLKGKINCKLGLALSQEGPTCKVSSRQAYFHTASNTPYSLAKYYLAKLYNTDTKNIRDEKFYKPQLACLLYSKIANEGPVNGHGKAIAAYPLAAYNLVKFYETGLKVGDFFLEVNLVTAFKHLTGAANRGHPYAQYELAKNYIENQKEVEGIFFLQQSAESGYSKAQLELAKKYETGFGDFLLNDSNLARFWYTKAAEQEGGEDANYSLGLTYENEKNYTQAIVFYNKSLNPRAHVRLGKMYLKGLGKEQNIYQAIKHFTTASDQGNADGSYYLGLMKFKRQGFEKCQIINALSYFSAAAEQNHSKALFRLGIIKQFGIGTTKNHDEAKTYYKRSGIADADYYLGNLYKRGVEPDAEQALKLWEKATESGHKRAAYKAGKFHWNEWTHKKDEEDAIKARLYLEKAGHDHTDAHYLLGKMQKKGIGGPLDSIAAIQSYTIVADAGHASAQFKLGKFYDEILEPRAPAKSLEYYTLSAKQNHGGARIALGEYYKARDERDEAFDYFKSLDKQINPSALAAIKKLAKGGHKKAISWLEEKAAEGNPEAQYYFGKLLETGDHLPQDMLKAVFLYKQAENQGQRSAQRRLNDFKQAHLFEALGITQPSLLSDQQNKSIHFVDSKGEEFLLTDTQCEKILNNSSNVEESKFFNTHKKDVQ